MGYICGYCGLEGRDQLRCSACKRVYYCSVICQRRDWKGKHKKQCKEIQNQKQGENTNCYEAEHQAYPRSGKRRKIQSVFPNSSKEQSRVNGKTPYLKCLTCGVSTLSVQRCSRCNKVTYCSKTCLRLNQDEHKLHCTTPEEEDYEIITTDGFRREEAFASRINRRAEFQQAKCLSQRTFARCTVLDFIWEIPSGIFERRPTVVSLIFVGYICMYDVLTKSIHLQDKLGDEVEAILCGVGQPHFRCDDVVPGRYLCIKDPFIDCFSRSILIDNSSKVRIFRV